MRCSAVEGRALIPVSKTGEGHSNEPAANHVRRVVKVLTEAGFTIYPLASGESTTTIPL
jgi:hypothetical protein